jgi:Bardet-Biedl syndrome 1 protein
MLVPGLEYTFETLVECVSDLGISDQIRVFVFSNKMVGTSAAGSGAKKQSLNGSVSSKPILSAVINMPVAEVV